VTCDGSCACGGSPPASGLPCICGGTNSGAEEKDGLRRLAVRLQYALGEIASLAGSPLFDFGGSADEQRAAIFNAARDALAGRHVRANDYRTRPY
jgi:hypothetical protein